MKFYSGFSLSNEDGYFDDYIDKSKYSISGFSYGSIFACKEVLEYLNNSKRVDTLQLFSPVFFQNKSDKFKRLQTMSYKKDKEEYLEHFIKSCFLPYKEKSLERIESTSEELDELLRYEWDIKELQYIQNSGVKIEVYLGGEDKIIDVLGAKEFFLPISTVTYIKDANHFLQIN